MKYITLVATIFSLLTIGCSETKETTTMEMNLSALSKVGKLCAPGDTGCKDIIILNIKDENLKPLYYAKRECGLDSPSCYVFDNIEVQPGPNRLFQVMFVDGGDNKIHYGDTTKNLNSGQNPDIQLNLQHTQTIAGQGHIMGRFLSASGTGKTGTIEMIAKPDPNKPGMLIETAEIFDGWFDVFSLKDVPFRYVIKGSGEVMFSGFDTNADGGVEYNEITAKIGSDTASDQIKYYKPASGVGFYKKRYTDSTGANWNWESLGDEETEMVFGFFGPGSVSGSTKQVCLISSTAFSHNFNGAGGRAELCKNDPGADTACGDQGAWIDAAGDVDIHNGNITNVCTAANIGKTELALFPENFGKHRTEVVGFDGPFRMDKFGSADYKFFNIVKDSATQWTVNWKYIEPAVMSGADIFMTTTGAYDHGQIKVNNEDIDCGKLQGHLGFQKVGNNVSAESFQLQGVSENNTTAVVCLKKPSGGYYQSIATFNNFNDGGMMGPMCPDGYVHIAADSNYTKKDFCVMKYEAKAEANAGGSFDMNGNLVARANFKPGSVAANFPWRQISKSDAVEECRELGYGYDLISNAQWQTIAQNIEQLGSNWTGGTYGNGCIFQGNNGEGYCGYNGLNPEQSSSNTRGVFTLNSGETIHDFAGNVWEWVKDNNTISYGVDGDLLAITLGTHSLELVLDDGVARKALDQFGYMSAIAGGNSGNNQRGFGYGYFAAASETIQRGGHWLTTDNSGVFSTFFNNDMITATAHTGFRCVYEAAECGTSVAIGGVCPGGAIYAGEFDNGNYMVTPSGCDDSATPTCSGAVDSLSKIWEGSSDPTNADIGTASNNVYHGTLAIAEAMSSSSLYRGYNNTFPIIDDISTNADSAAAYCYDMDFGGFTDWYLPSKSELAYLYCKAGVSSGSHAATNPTESPCTGNVRTGELGGFVNDHYWSSTEYDGNKVWALLFANGQYVAVTKETTGKQVRCIRRY